MKMDQLRRECHLEPGHIRRHRAYIHWEVVDTCTKHDWEIRPTAAGDNYECLCCGVYRD